MTDSEGGCHWVFVAGIGWCFCSDKDSVSKIGLTQNGWFIVEHPIQMDINVFQVLSLERLLNRERWSLEIQLEYFHWS